MSLADIFKRNKKQMAEKYEHQEKQEEKAEQKEQKPTRTKEDILKQRKAMMEYKGPVDQKGRAQTVQEGSKGSQGEIGNPFGKSDQKNGPNSDLLDRLAFGKKTKVGEPTSMNINFELGV